MNPQLQKHLPLLKLGVVILVLAVGGIVACAYFVSKPNHGTLPLNALAFSLIAVAIASFYGSLWYFQSLGGNFSLDKNGMRLSIVISVITVFLDLVATTAFFGSSSNEVPELTKTLLTCFSNVVMTVIAFYFGTSAYIQVNDKKNSKNQSENSEK